MCILLENSTKMWPMYVDYSDEECRRVLRSLELEAYANIVNVFRAQGNLSKERKKMLQDLCSMLSISMDRHRAEIRRAVNDEHLNTIAERLCGPNTATEWAMEGRRVVPLMPRINPQTVFTAVADTVANTQATKNATLPLPSKTGVREIGNGFETMASRKRKEPPPDASISPNKIIALDNQYFNNLCSVENNYSPPEASQMQTSSANSDILSPPETAAIDPTTTTATAMQFSSFSEQLPIKTTASILTSTTTSSVSLTKPPPKQIMLKSSSTVTTFSSFDQLNTNLLSNKPASQSPVPTAAHEENILAVPDVSKQPSTESRSFQRSSPSVTLKTPSIIPTTSSNTMTTTSDRLPISSTTTSTMGNKFLTQIRCKNTGHARQNLSLGLKLNSQSHMSQKGLSPKASTNLKVKQDNSSFFTKKISQSVFSSSSTDSQSQFSLSSGTESTSATKSPITVTKSSVKTESSIVTNAQPSNKLTTVTKNFPKTSTPSSLTRSIFSTTTKPGAKSLPPVIFNVSSTACTSLQTTTKTTVSMASDGTKTTTPQLLPKSTSVGLTPSHLKINASNAPTIQYRNDGGVMRSARIVNISQTGNRLPCAISSSTISALGLSPNMTSAALRVTLPPGTLHTSSSLRPSTAAKPNVIVVHKAMWPKSQGAMIMSSGASMSKITNDDSGSSTQKQEKSRLSGAKLAPRPIASIASAQTSSPAVSAASLKFPETSLMANPLANKPSPPDNNSVPITDNSNPKTQENSTENQCKKNLLADVIEASGILESGPEKAASVVKDKSEIAKMVRNLVRKSDKTNVSEETMKAAVLEVKLEKKSIRGVAHHYGIPRKTLGRYCNRYEGLVQSSNQSSVLPSSDLDSPRSTEKTLVAPTSEVQSSSLAPVSKLNVKSQLFDKETKEEKKHCVVESEAKSLVKPISASSVVDAAPTVSQESNNPKQELIKSNKTESVLSADVEKNRVSTKLRENPTENKEIVASVSSEVKETVTNATENSSMQTETSKEKNS